MSNQYDNTNRGALFKNDDKQSDNHPDYKGSINVGGRDFWLSAWLKESKQGRMYMSLSVKPKEARQEAPQTQSRNMQPDDEFDSDLPF
jgi:uncharacterized protein (DUF736 family)